MGVPDGLDADTTQRMVRTFLAIRIVRGSLLLLFLVIALVAVELRSWPSGVAIVIALAMLAQVAALVSWCLRYSSAGRGTRHRGWP